MKPQPLCRSADELIRQLRRILTEGGSGNFLVASVGPAFVQFAAERGNPVIQMEVASNAELPPPYRLEDAAIQRLHRMGFLITIDGSNYRRAVEIEDEVSLAHLAHQTVLILEGVYGCDPREPLHLGCEMQRFQHPKNPDFVATLYELDRMPTRENWDRLCERLYDAHLLMPVDETHTALHLRDPDNRPVLPVFTDYEALLALYPEGSAYTIMPGIDLLNWLVEKRVWPVMINPAGPLLLELSRTQIEALAAAPAPAPAPAQPTTERRQQPVF